MPRKSNRELEEYAIADEPGVEDRDEILHALTEPFTYEKVKSDTISVRLLNTDVFEVAGQKVVIAIQEYGGYPRLIDAGAVDRTTYSVQELPQEVVFDAIQPYTFELEIDAVLPTREQIQHAMWARGLFSKEDLRVKDKLYAKNIVVKELG